MHFVGVGAAMNRSLATAIARAGRGAEVLAGFGDDVERATKRLLDRTARPVLTDVTVEGGAVVEVAPQHVPDVFAGSPVVAAVKLAAEGGDVIVRGKLAGGAIWERRVHVGAVAAGEGNQAIVSLFGRELVADLEMRWTIGRETELIDRTIERAGVVFQIATRMTSWVAVDQVRSVDRTSDDVRVVQPQEIPYGTSLASFGLDQLAELADEAPARLSMAMPARPRGMVMEQTRVVTSRLGGAMPGAPPAPSRGAPAPTQAPAPMLLESAQPSALPTKRTRPLGLFLVLFVLLLILATILWLIFR
jgi:Ca-activated chloride channel family protein